MKLEDLKQRYPDAIAFKFGDGPELSAQLVALVRSGKKTATCGALRDFGDGGEPLPEEGRRNIVLNWDGSPALVIETIQVEQARFCDVETDFALAEGENDTLEGWQHDHQKFFERNGGFVPEMMLICERFKLIEDLKTEGD
ncbi:ASCH domain-containing protein [uncultured Roseibium sp.]|uniref:ASCH domain-containing protein n=1 Tax=uncultured Roseibium sp. TaxID=1936171 RepID=UPI00259A8FD7|nr:ASCH domain-containing protein [uncultured Roseibium sp.]